MHNTPIISRNVVCSCPIPPLIPSETPIQHNIFSTRHTSKGISICRGLRPVLSQNRDPSKSQRPVHFYKYRPIRHVNRVPLYRRLPCNSLRSLRVDLGPAGVLDPGRFASFSLVGECCLRLVCCRHLILLFRGQGIDFFSRLHQAAAVLLLQLGAYLIQREQDRSSVDV